LLGGWGYTGLLSPSSAACTASWPLSAPVERYAGEVDAGHRLVVRNGRARERKVTVGSGTIPLKAPQVNDKPVDEQGERQKFWSDRLSSVRPL
jgi:hypothetical protein